jgi:hypothetical protein
MQVGRMSGKAMTLQGDEVSMMADALRELAGLFSISCGVLDETVVRGGPFLLREIRAKVQRAIDSEASDEC